MNFPILTISQKTSKCGTNNAYTFLLLMCRWFVLTILMSSVVYYWTDTWQHGIYFLTRYKKYAKKNGCSRNRAGFQMARYARKKTQFQQPQIMHTWALRPMPPLNLRNGIICFLAITSFRYLLALRTCKPLMATAVSCVFLKCTRRLEPRALQDFVGFSGSAAYRVILCYFTYRRKSTLIFLRDRNTLTAA